MEKKSENRGERSGFSFSKKILNKIKGLFLPEEVEVTFKYNGKDTEYTYHVISHKH